MSAAICPLVVGNWKMNGDAAAMCEARAVADELSLAPVKAQVVLCPPATLISRLVETLAGTGIAVGGQDCHFRAGGAHTGDVSASMLAEVGATYVIVGHSERRVSHGETDSDIAAKAAAAIQAGLRPIVCVGETLEDRRAGRTLAVLKQQLASSLPSAAVESAGAIAYEPVWAIGSGLTPSISEIVEVHATIRDRLDELKAFGGASAQVLYGGSVNPENARAILTVAECNGVLVGGASLNAKAFLGVLAALR